MSKDFKRKARGVVVFSAAMPAVFSNSNTSNVAKAGLLEDLKKLFKNSNSVPAENYRNTTIINRIVSDLFKESFFEISEFLTRSLHDKVCEEAKGGSTQLPVEEQLDSIYNCVLCVLNENEEVVRKLRNSIDVAKQFVQCARVLNSEKFYDAKSDDEKRAKLILKFKYYWCTKKALNKMKELACTVENIAGVSNQLLRLSDDLWNCFPGFYSTSNDSADYKIEVEMVRKLITVMLEKITAHKAIVGKLTNVAGMYDEVEKKIIESESSRNNSRNDIGKGESAMKMRDDWTFNNCALYAGIHGLASPEDEKCWLSFSSLSDEKLEARMNAAARDGVSTGKVTAAQKEAWDKLPKDKKVFEVERFRFICQKMYECVDSVKERRAFSVIGDFGLNSSVYAKWYFEHENKLLGGRKDGKLIREATSYLDANLVQRALGIHGTSDADMNEDLKLVNDEARGCAAYELPPFLELFSSSAWVPLAKSDEDTTTMKGLVYDRNGSNIQTDVETGAVVLNDKDGKKKYLATVTCLEAGEYWRCLVPVYDVSRKIVGYYEYDCHGKENKTLSLEEFETLMKDDNTQLGIGRFTDFDNIEKYKDFYVPADTDRNKLSLPIIDREEENELNEFSLFMDENVTTNNNLPPQ